MAFQKTVHSRRLAHTLRIAGATGLCIAGVCGLWLRSQRHQYDLDRRLIAALVTNDNPQAIQLVKQGTDPNTRYEARPVPSLKQIVHSFLNRSAPPPNNSPTAFRIVCGEFWSVEGADVWLHRPDAPELAQSMLQHGARGNEKGQGGCTPRSRFTEACLWSRCQGEQIVSRKREREKSRTAEERSG